MDRPLTPNEQENVRLAIADLEDMERRRAHAERKRQQKWKDYYEQLAKQPQHPIGAKGPSWRSKEFD